MRGAALLALMALPLPAMAEQVVLGLRKDEVAITTNFDGSELLVFGAVKREAPIPVEPLDVVVAIAGPSQPVVVRRLAVVAPLFAPPSAAPWPPTATPSSSMTTCRRWARWPHATSMS